MIRNSAFIIGLILGALGFCALPLYGQTPEGSSQPITPIMKCRLLKPSYRGLSFDDESKTQIEALVQLNLQGWGLSLDDVSLYARFGNPALRDITIKKSILDLKSQELKVNFEVEALPINEYTLAISLRRKNAEAEFLDEQLAFKAFKIKRMPAIERQKMTLLKADGSVLVNDQTFFPIGVYLQNQNQNQKVSELDLDFLDLNLKSTSEMGFNCVLTSIHPLLDKAEEYLYSAHKYGLKVICLLKELTPEKEKEYIARLKGQPAILGWCLGDIGGQNPLELEKLKELKERYELIKSLDLNHPAYAFWPQAQPLDKAIDMDIEKYFELIEGDLNLNLKKSQIYSALIHGAKGLILRPDRHSDESRDAISQFVSELKAMVPYLLSPSGNELIR